MTHDHDATSPATSVPISEDTPLVQQHQQTSCNLLPHTLISLFLFSSSTAVVTSIRPQLILDTFGDNPSQAATFNGIVLSLQSLLTVVLSPLCGAVSDVVGRKMIFLLAHTGEFFNLFLLSQFPTSVYAQFFANMLLVSSSVYFSLIQAIVADIAARSTSKPAATYYAYIGGTFGACFLYGPALGGLLEERVYPLASIHLGAAFVVVAVVYATLFLPETLDQQEEQASFKKIIQTFKTVDINPIPRVYSFVSQSPGLRYLACMYAMEVISLSGLASIIYIYASTRLNWGPEQFGLYLTAFGVVLLVGQVGLTRVALRLMGERAAMLTGFASLILSYFSYAFVTKTYQMYVILFFSVFGFIIDPAFKGIVARQVPSHLQGGLQGSFSAVGNMVKPISPILTNLFFTLGLSIGFDGLAFVALAGVKCAGLFFAWKAFSSPGLI